MTIEDNKRSAVELFARFSASDIPGVLALMTDDVTWRVPGKPELSPVAGIYNKDRLKRLFERMLAQLEGGLHMTVLGLIGRKYRQQYHFLITFHDGRIASVREYLDTHHAFDVWMRP